MNYENIYAELVRKIEAYEKEGKRISRYGAVIMLLSIVPHIRNYDLDLIDKLYADGIVSA